MIESKYLPKTRFVVEISKPKILRAFMNGEQIDPARLKASITVSNRQVHVETTIDAMKDLTGVEYPAGAFGDMEVEFVDEG